MINKAGSGADLQFDGIKYYILKGRGAENKFILKDISGIFKSGQLSAIMGPSGSGKSSLMNILAGYRKKNVTGNIYVNGEARDPNEFRKITSYIMQEDLLLPHLSVEETMMCSANLKLGKRFTLETKHRMVSEILSNLSLGDSLSTRTSELSGGQKKRLAIAQELVNNPPVMFFDEPTSGLDSASCHQCITLLHKLSRDGRTIICTIHQPSAKIFEMFDYLYFLADGHCIYRGPVNCLVPYLSSQELICPPYHNPADYFMEVACGEHGDNVLRLAWAVRRGVLNETICKLTEPPRSCHDTALDWRTMLDKISNQGESLNPLNGQGNQNIDAQEEQPNENCSEGLIISQESVELTIQSHVVNCSTKKSFCNSFPKSTKSRVQKTGTQQRTFETNLFTQFRILFIRSTYSIMRDSTLTHLRLVSHAIVGLLIGLLYFRIGNLGREVIGNAAFIFFSLLFIMFAALMPTVMTFPTEMPIFFREHMNYWYTLKAYYLAKSFADVPFQVFFPIVYGSIVYWMTDQPSDALRFFLFLVICVLTSLVGQSLGLLIGAATSLQVAVFLGPVTGIPILLFSGFFLSLDLIPSYLQWLSYISFTRYSFAGAIKVIYGLNRTNLDCSPRIDRKTSFPCVKDAALVIDSLSVGHSEVFFDFLILFLFFIGLRLLCYFILRWRVRGHH